MRNSLTHALVVAALLVAAFASGQMSGSGGGILGASAPGDALALRPQGQGQQNPNSGAGNTLPTTPVDEPLVYGGDSGQSAAANGFIAVTGSYGVGTSVLYVLDTETRQLAVYEARGGSPGGRRLVLVGARRIDLDLRLEGYNDESEFSYRDLAQRFARREDQGASTDASGRRTDGPSSAGATDPGARRK